MVPSPYAARDTARYNAWLADHRLNGLMHFLESGLVFYAPELLPCQEVYCQEIAYVATDWEQWRVDNVPGIGPQQVRWQLSGIHMQAVMWYEHLGGFPPGSPHWDEWCELWATPPESPEVAPHIPDSDDTTEETSDDSGDASVMSN